jgi:RNA polymerase sigma-70 factor (ECF subfamily)
MEELSDEALVERYRSQTGASAGNLFLDQLFQRHHSRVAAWCYRMTGDVGLAADLAQEIFLKAFQHIGSFRGESKFTTWLYSIARNRCMDELRSRASRPEEKPDATLDEMADLRTEDISAALERKDSEAVLKRMMRESLDEVEMHVMTLHYAEEMPLDAITRLLRLTNPSGAKAHIVSARRKLSQSLDRWKQSQRRPRGGAAAE